MPTKLIEFILELGKELSEEFRKFKEASATWLLANSEESRKLLRATEELDQKSKDRLLYTSKFSEFLDSDNGKKLSSNLNKMMDLIKNLNQTSTRADADIPELNTSTGAELLKLKEHAEQVKKIIQDAKTGGQHHYWTPEVTTHLNNICDKAEMVEKIVQWIEDNSQKNLSGPALEKAINEFITTIRHEDYMKGLNPGMNTALSIVYHDMRKKPTKAQEAAAKKASKARNSEEDSEADEEMIIDLLLDDDESSDSPPPLQTGKPSRLS